MSVEQLGPEQNPIHTKIVQAVGQAVDSVVEAHSSQITYVEIVGALEIIKSSYALEMIALNSMDE